MTQHHPRIRRPALAAALAMSFLAAGAAGGPTPASAQGAGPGTMPGLLPPPAETSQGPGNAGAGNPAVAQDRRSRSGMERRIQDWHDRLRITPAQEPQWSAFAGAMRENMQHMRAMQAEQRQAAGTASALDDIRNYAHATQAHAQDVQRLVAPFEALYNVLSPEQRQAADQAFRRFEERGGGRLRGRTG